MKFEFGFQANCSELVSNITIPDFSSLKEAMMRIQEVTGWSWWYYDFEIDLQLYLPPDKWDELLVYNEEKGYFGVDVQKLLKLWKDEIPDKVRPDLEDDRNAMWDCPGSPFYPCSPSLIDIPPEEKVCNREITDFESAWSCHFDKKKGGFTMHMLINCYESPLYPILHWVRAEYDGDYYFLDGGSTQCYEEWMAFHFFNEDFFREYPQYRRYKKSNFYFKNESSLNYPPLPGSKGLVESDHEKFEPQLRFDGNHKWKWWEIILLPFFFVFIVLRVILGGLFDCIKKQVRKNK